MERFINLPMRPTISDQRRAHWLYCPMDRCLTRDPLPKFAKPNGVGDTPQTFLSDMEQPNLLQPIPATRDLSDAGWIIGLDY